MHGVFVLGRRFNADFIITAMYVVVKVMCL